MSPAGELLLSMLPPLTFDCSSLTVSAILEPAYDVGGDAFDYAVDGATARFLILDAMGRGLNAALTSATALAAIRASRRQGQDIHQMAEASHTAIRGQFSDLRFATAILSELDLTTGILNYINAGHPPAVLIRGGKAVKELTGGGRVPMGLFDKIGDTVGTEMMEPGDQLLFYTDGIVEARDATGQIFGLQRLIDLAERHADDTLPAPETLRRLSHSVMAHQSGPPVDDATMLLVQWSAEAAQRMIKP
jgi:serine phosphatase RsbU (regulator of sigma subunit)